MKQNVLSSNKTVTLMKQNVLSSDKTVTLMKQNILSSNKTVTLMKQNILSSNKTVTLVWQPHPHLGPYKWNFSPSNFPTHVPLRRAVFCPSLL
jgi:hypothetical protein